MRPDDWNEMFHQRYRELVRAEGDNLRVRPDLLYEAGADAMLEALKEHGELEEVVNGHVLTVFIEEEK